MNILILSHKPPYPIVDGGCHAMDRFLRDALRAFPEANFNYLSIATQKHDFDENEIPEELKKRATFDHVKISTKLNPISALIQVFKNRSYHMSRFKQSAILNKLQSITGEKKIDLVFFESLFCSAYSKEIKLQTSASQILRAHNVEHLIWSKLATNTKNPLKKWYLNHVSKTLKTFETRFVKEVDFIFSIAQADQEFFKSLNHNTCYLPVSMEVTSAREIISDSICFLGAYNWMPNKEGILWFTNEVWPEIVLNNPATTLNIAGSFSEEISELQNKDSIKLHGFVPSSEAFMKAYGLFVAPILSGSGVKMKVLEAMSHGVPCVLSSHAAEGLNLPEIIPVCANKETFIEQVSLLLQNKDLCKQIGKAGQEFILKNYNSVAVSEKITKLLRK